MAEDEHDGLVRRFHYDPQRLDITIYENEAVLITTGSPDFPTPRRLQVGDSRQDLIRLYSEPFEQTELANDNQWLSYDLDGYLLALHAELQDDEIIRLQINLGPEQPYL